MFNLLSKQTHTLHRIATKRTRKIQEVCFRLYDYFGQTYHLARLCSKYALPNAVIVILNN